MHEFNLALEAEVWRYYVRKLIAKDPAEQAVASLEFCNRHKLPHLGILLKRVGGDTIDSPSTIGTISSTCVGARLDDACIIVLQKEKEVARVIPFDSTWLAPLMQAYPDLIRMMLFRCKADPERCKIVAFGIPDAILANTMDGRCI